MGFQRCKSKQISRKILLPLTGKRLLALNRFIPYFLPVSLFLLLLFSGCANPVSPEGGPKDTSPPEPVRFSPPENSVNYTGRTIRIDFNEFINAETSGDKILVSPPLTENPEYRLRGKTLVVAFRDSLLPNTTYSIDFGRSISDITENNKIPGLRYAFSTGETIDSLVLRGSVTDAFTALPVKGALVMLYALTEDTIPPDSLPMLVRPKYMTRTGDDGTFMLSNLGPGPYKMFSLADKSGDLLFNVTGEQIAFLDSLAVPLPPQASGPAWSFRMFTPRDSLQFLDDVKTVRERMVNLIFRNPVRNLRLIPMNADSSLSWCILEPGMNGDTVTLWLTGELPDTLQLKIQADHMPDDTAQILVKYSEPQKKGKKAEGGPAKRLEIEPNTRGGVLNQFKTPLILTASYPLSGCDLNSIFLVRGNDTVSIQASFSDSARRHIRTIHPFAEGTVYQVFIPGGSFVSVNGLKNDTLRIPFRTSESGNFANLKINLKFPEGASQVIVQLMNEKENLLEQQVLKEPGRISFDYLLPGKFKIRAIVDQNQNTRWDSGDYLHKIQPETVFYFPRILELRQNWDVEETWEL